MNNSHKQMSKPPARGENSTLNRVGFKRQNGDIFVSTHTRYAGDASAVKPLFKEFAAEDICATTESAVKKWKKAWRMEAVPL